MDPEVHYVTDRDAGIALITGQIVEAWLNRLPRVRDNVKPELVAEMITAVRTSLLTPIPGIENEAKPRGGSSVTNLRPVS